MPLVIKAQTFFGEAIGDREFLVEGCDPYGACKDKANCLTHSEWADPTLNRMSLLSSVKQAEPQEDPPTKPIVSCLECKKDFVWWIHPVQLCDDCVQKEYDKKDV